MVIKNYFSILFIFLCINAYSQDVKQKWPVLKTYEGMFTSEVAMPLGGIGTGTVSIGGRGDLRDWEIMNRGAIGYLPAFKFVPPTIANGPFFALYYKSEGGEANIRVLEGPVSVDEYYGDWGADAVNSGFPRFKETTFSAAYPLAQVDFEHPEVPLEVKLEAFNPLVMGDEDKSGIPVAVLRYVLTNNSSNRVEAAVCGMVPNYIGVDGWSGEPQGNKNEYRQQSGLQGIYMFSEYLDSTHVNWGTMSLTTNSDEDVSYRTTWAKLPWNWTFREFWDDFLADGKVTAIKNDESGMDNSEVNPFSGSGIPDIKTPPATLAVKVDLAPGETKTITYFLTWHFPNRRAWDNGRNPNNDKIVGNYYTTQYNDAWDVAEKVASDLEELENQTVKFVSALVENDIPEVLKEAALFNLNNLRSQTVFRTSDGLPFGWEGTGSIFGTKIGAERSSGWGPGTCTHVWNYESTTPFVFGNLAKKFREVEFKHATHEDGFMEFRVWLPLHEEGKFAPYGAADGQMGTIIKAYREWQLSGDDQMLQEMWPNIKQAMSYAWKGEWDKNKDGVMEGSQHNTMDINYLGPNPQMAAWYLGALKASELMANYLNDKAFAKECKSLFEKGSKWIDSNIFNGEYYEHKIPDNTTKIAQLGKGCLVDQLVGQYLAHTTGLGYVLNKNNVQATLKSIMKYNYVEGFNEHFNTFRSFGLGDEEGLVMASYPKGELLDFPFPYYTEIMTGFEYSTAAHMLYEGQTEEGLKVFKAIRDRFDGYKRNPFNEGEYGHRYARAMAAWAGILGYTGFYFSAVDKSMSFNPLEGNYFWSNGYQYGIVSISSVADRMNVSIKSLNGDLELRSFTLNNFGKENFKQGITVSEGQEATFTVAKRK